MLAICKMSLMNMHRTKCAKFDVYSSSMCELSRELHVRRSLTLTSVFRVGVALMLKKGLMIMVIIITDRMIFRHGTLGTTY